MDGMVLPDDTPTPGLAEFAAVSAPLRFSRDGATLYVRSRYHSVDTRHLRFVALVEADGVVTETVELDVPPVGPGVTIPLGLPEQLLAGTAPDTWLTVRAELAADLPWAPAGHVVALTQFALGAPAAAVGRGVPVPTGALPVTADGPLTLGPATFDPLTGGLLSLHGVEVAGPRLELWRGPTDNDRGGMNGSYELGSPEETGGRGAPGPSSERRWRERGLHRLVHRVQEVTAAADHLVSRVRVSPANSGLTVDVRYLWQLDGDDAVTLTVEAVPSPGWDCTWPRVGVRFDLPATLTRAGWYGTGPHESYPDSATAARVGTFTADVDELNVRYSRPQETGHRPELRRLELSDSDAPRLAVRTTPDLAGHRPGFTLTRWTPQQLDVARHPYELPENDRVYLFLDDAVHGLGSRACGIDVLPKHALWPGARTFTVTFEAPR
jgi:beta-galactosidase